MASIVIVILSVISLGYAIPKVSKKKKKKNLARESLVWPSGAILPGRLPC